VSKSDDKILYEKDGRVGHFTINRPDKCNAMSLDMWRRMREIFEAWANDPEIRVIVVRGAGDKCFCAGNDISEFKNLRSTPDGIATYHAITEQAYAALRGIAKPTIACIEGFCMGGGFEVAQLCDIQIASDTATFAVTPAKLGIGYKLDDVRLLTDSVGAKHAKEILFTGRRFQAADALRWGIVNRVVAVANLDAVVDGYVEEIAANAPLSVKAAKIIVNEAVKEAADRDDALCESLVDACNESDDYTEGQRAFAEKRKPDFKGR
jgi:enoyl-CoA hydratase/carnithine racemase